MQTLRLAVQQRIFPQYRREFFEQLAQNDCDLHLFSGQPQDREGIVQCSEPYPPWYTRGANRYRFPKPFSVVFQNDAMSWLEACKPDVLVIEANPRMISSRGLVDEMHRRGKPVLGWGLGFLPRASYSKHLRRRLYFPLIRRLDGAIAYGENAAETYREFGLPQNRVFVAPNSATSSRTEAMPMPCMDDAPTFVFVGRITKPKRLVELIRSAKELQDESPVKIHIVGDGPERAAAERLAAELAIDCTFHGHQTGSELDRIYETSHLLVLPGSGGLAIQDAMSRGRPIIVGQGDGTQTDSVDKANGWLVDESGLTETLRTAIRSRSEWNAMADASFHRSKEGQNVDVMASQFLSAVSTVAELGPLKSTRVSN